MSVVGARLLVCACVIVIVFLLRVETMYNRYMLKRCAQRYVGKLLYVPANQMMRHASDVPRVHCKGEPITLYASFFGIITDVGRGEVRGKTKAHPYTAVTFVSSHDGRSYMVPLSVFERLDKTSRRYRDLSLLHVV